MATIDIKLKLEGLGRDLDNISKAIKKNIQSAVQQVAIQIRNNIIAKANERLRSTRQDYIRCVKDDQIGNSAYIIWLEDEVNYLEDGYSGFDMKPGMVNGPRSKQSAKGGRYNTIPFEHKPFSKEPVSQHAQDLQGALLGIIKDNKLDKIFKDPSGQPREGIVAQIFGTGVRDLEGLTKIQKTYNKRTQSFYVTFRRVSDKSKEFKWQHPGFKGANIFKDAETEAHKAIDDMLEQILGNK